MTDRRRRPERDGRERLDPRVALVLLPVTTEVEGQHFGGGAAHVERGRDTSRRELATQIYWEMEEGGQRAGRAARAQDENATARRARP